MHNVTDCLIQCFRSVSVFCFRIIYVQSVNVLKYLTLSCLNCYILVFCLLFIKSSWFLDMRVCCYIHFKSTEGHCEEVRFKRYIREISASSLLNSNSKTS